MKCKNFAKSSGQLVGRDSQIYVSLQQNTNLDNTHMFKIIVNTSTEPTLYRDNKIQVFTSRDNKPRYLKTHTIPKARDQITNQLFICLLTPRGVPVNVKYRGYTHDTKHSFYSAHFLVTLFIYLAAVLHRYCLGGALHVGMYRPRKALLDCPLLQHSSPGPKWTICMLSHSAQGIQINWFT